jgi:hypothetical protein
LKWRGGLGFHDAIYVLVIEAVNSSKIAARYMAVTIVCPVTTEVFMPPYVSETCHDYGKNSGEGKGANKKVTDYENTNCILSLKSSISM